MTASIGHPTLRLLRVRVGGFWLDGLKEGKWKVLTAEERERVGKTGRP
jgi:23S rRNA pseudouridine2457 synthase